MHEPASGPNSELRELLKHVRLAKNIDALKIRLVWKNSIHVLT